MTKRRFKYILELRIAVIVFGTTMYFIAFYFADKRISWHVLVAHKGDPELYLCLLYSFLLAVIGELWIFGDKFSRKIDK